MEDYREELSISTVDDRVYNFYTDEITYELTLDKTIFKVRAKEAVYSFPLANIVLIKTHQKFIGLTEEEKVIAEDFANYMQEWEEKYGNSSN